MKHQQELLGAWRLRTGPGDTEQFSNEARLRITALFLEVAGASSGVQNINGEENTDLEDWPTELVQLGTEEGLPVPVFCAELRNCQLSLIDILTSNALESSQQQSLASEQQGALRSLATLLTSLDGLITRSAQTFRQVVDSQSGATTSPDDNGKQGKTLQHEIRTPLQGALLTTELMLEDAAQGDPVSADDILAVRKSIETAVGILNDFANRSSAE